MWAAAAGGAILNKMLHEGVHDLQLQPRIGHLMQTKPVYFAVQAPERPDVTSVVGLRQAASKWTVPPLVKLSQCRTYIGCDALNRSDCQQLCGLS